MARWVRAFGTLSTAGVNNHAALTRKHVAFVYVILRTPMFVDPCPKGLFHPFKHGSLWNINCSVLS